MKKGDLPTDVASLILSVLAVSISGVTLYLTQVYEKHSIKFRYLESAYTYPIGDQLPSFQLKYALVNSGTTDAMVTRSDFDIVGDKNDDHDPDSPSREEIIDPVLLRATEIRVFSIKINIEDNDIPNDADFVDFVLDLQTMDSKANSYRVRFTVGYWSAAREGRFSFAPPGYVLELMRMGTVSRFEHIAGAHFATPTNR